MIDRIEAQQLLRRHTGRTPITELPLEKVAGHILAEDVIADLTVPPSAMSAMDGYAIRFRDLQNGTGRFRVVGHAAAGTLYPGPVEAGQAVRIFTGSVIPEGADHVVIQEDTDADNGHIQVRERQDRPQNIRAAGIDFSKGDKLLAAGTCLGGVEVAAAAAANRPSLRVHKRPKVALLANGDELALPGTAIGPANVICSTPFGLSRLIEDWGGDASFAGIARDSRASILEHIETCRDADIILPLGGASVGDHDHMKDAFAAAGLSLVFSKVSVKPGKPTWFGMLGTSCVLGLPGNPASAVTCAILFLRPLLAMLQGGKGDFNPVHARAAMRMPANGSREEFLRGAMTIDPDGVVWVTPARNQDSSLLSPFLTANVLIQRPAHANAVEAGTPLTCFTFRH